MVDIRRLWIIIRRPGVHSSTVELGIWSGKFCRAILFECAQPHIFRKAKSRGAVVWRVFRICSHWVPGSYWRFRFTEPCFRIGIKSIIWLVIWIVSIINVIRILHILPVRWLKQEKFNYPVGLVGRSCGMCSVQWARFDTQPIGLITYCLRLRPFVIFRIYMSYCFIGVRQIAWHDVSYLKA